jgi:hypothetical protein
MLSETRAKRFRANLHSTHIVSIIGATFLSKCQPSTAGFGLEVSFRILSESPPLLSAIVYAANRVVVAAASSQLRHTTIKG